MFDWSIFVDFVVNFFQDGTILTYKKGPRLIGGFFAKL